MRALVVLLGAAVLTACATGSRPEDARMPLEVFRAEGEVPRLGPVMLVVGEYSSASPFVFRIWFENADAKLGAPEMVGWAMRFTDYCRDRRSWVRADLIGPDGRRWAGQREIVPAGPERYEDWAGGPANGTAPGRLPADLVDALAVGGPFTLQLEDDEGRVLGAHTFDTLTRPQRQALFSANYRQFLATDPNMPVKEEMLEWRGYRPPLAVRPCPSA
jgi:hypothetical protein